MSLFGRTTDILGINARNLLYLSKYNSKANKKLADDKIYTKRFLQARGIGVAKLYATVKTHSELKNFNKNILPKSFVIKPNKGYGGEGIISIKEKRNNEYISVDGQKYSWSDIANHCIGIIDGRYAISGLGDTVIFEEQLQPHEYFNKYSEGGLPDIRIIVFKYVPIIAMLRLPTVTSQGKANLHLGAIGLGIDIGTGKTTFGVRYNNLIKKLPTGELVSSLTIPQWDDILFTAANTQKLTQIGYLAVDIALTNNGIKILELNARAGLAIQISNQALLRKRLEKVVDLKVPTPTEGVKIGKTIFTRVVKETSTKSPSKPIIGLFEYVDILNAKPGHLQAKIDPHSQKTVIDSSLDVPISDKLLTIKMRDKKFRMPFIRQELKDSDYKIVIAGKYLTDFLIDTAQTAKEKILSVSRTTREEKIIANIDKKIHVISETIHLLGRLKPQNLEAERVKFLKKPDKSPQFSYKQFDLDTKFLRNELKKIPRKIDHPLLPLFQEKIEEIQNKISLIENVGNVECLHFAKKIFGQVSPVQYEEAINFFQNTPIQNDASKKISTEEIIKRITKYLADNKLARWKVKILEQATSGMQVNKKNTIFLNKKEKISLNRLQALIAHEIETHIFRLENGRLQKYKLFEQGTASYLSAEEGLAIFNQNRLNLPLGEKQFSPALNIVAIYQGEKMSFVELFHYLLKNFRISQERAWRTCLRVKRGLSNTSAVGAFTKDRVYFSGYNLIKQLVKDKGLAEVKKLYVGKIGIPDLKYVSNLNQWPITYLPKYLK